MCTTTTAKHTRKVEVQREVALTHPDSLDRGGCTPTQRQIVRWTGPIQELTGYTSEEIQCTEAWWLDHIHPDDRSRVFNSLFRHLKNIPGDPYAAESRIWGADYRLLRSDGGYVLVSDRTITARDEDGNAISFTSVIFDKKMRRTQRQQHAQMLESQNFLSLVAKNTPSGIFMMDPQGYATYMNTAAEQITGFTFEEIYDYTFHAAVHSCRENGDPYPLIECPVFRCQQEGRAVSNETEVFVHKDGRHYDIVYSISPIGDYGTGGSVIEFRDVTDEKCIEQERLNAILKNEEQSIRIKESENHKANLASFVSFVCHELRNPLQGVTSSAEFLADTIDKIDSLTKSLATFQTENTSINAQEPEQGTTAANSLTPDNRPITKRTSGVVDSSTLAAMDGLLTYAKELVSNIATCASHQALITNNVLDLSRLDAGKVEPSLDVVDIQALGRQTVSMMAARAQVKNINLAMADKHAPPLYLKADQTLLSQVILNLVSNAIKFTPENGSIIVDLYPDAPNKQGQVVLHGLVSDNGLGMTEQEQQRLFQRFSQANRKVAQLYGGSGLGLSISKELVRVMGGEMSVRSESGKGSTFSFTSLHDPPTQPELLDFLRTNSHKDDGLTEKARTMSLNDLPSSEPPSFKKVCVAEDNPINLKHLSKHLNILGYEHVLCTNGQEALDMFCEENSGIDVLIIDMSMPVMDGLEATSRIREFEAANSLRRVPIIALSGNAMREQVEEAMTAGTSDYLVKPCKQADLGRTMKHWEQIVHSGAPHRPSSDTKRMR